MDFGNINYIGKLPKLPFGELIYSLQAQKEEGLLYLRRDHVAKRLFWKKGKIIHVDSNLSRESFPRQCIEQGILDESQVLNYLEKAIETNLPLETLLLQEKVLPGDKIAEILRVSYRRSVIEIFGWEKGSFAFFFDQEPGNLHEGTSISLNSAQIVLEGIKAHYTRKKLKTLLRSHLDESWELTEEPAELQNLMELTPEETDIVRKIKSNQKVSNILFGSKSEMGISVPLLLAIKTLRLAKDPNSNQLITDLSIPKDLEPEEKAVATLLVENGTSIFEKDPFELLQVSRYFDDTELRRGYYNLAQMYHQREIIDRLPEQLQELSNMIFTRISDCFEALLKVERNSREANYEEFQSFFLEHNMPFEKHYENEIHFLKGKNLFDQKNFIDALPLLAEASQKRSYEGEYKYYKAFCEYRAHADGAKAIHELRRAIELDYCFIPSHLGMAKVYENENNRELAHTSYRNALALDTTNPESRKGYQNTKEAFKLGKLQDEVANGLDKEEILNKLETFLEKIKKQNFFEILNVKETSPESSIRRAYFQLAKEFHPDRLGSLKNHPVAEEVFLRINTAYDVLSSDKKRRFYERSLKAQEREAEFKKSQKQIELDKMFIKGEALLNGNRPAEAFNLFKKIDSERGGCAQCKAYMGYAIFLQKGKTSPLAVKESESLFEQSLKLDPEYLTANILWGKMYRQLQQYPKALRFFKKVLNEEPDNVEALREVRLINQRIGQKKAEVEASKPQEAKKGLFGSIFSRKK